MEYMGRKVWFDKKGYATIWLAGKSVKVHVLEWESRHGAKPLGHDIHHKDEDKGNWHISNLELMTKEDHARHHAGWVKENGVWAKKPCTKCHAVLPLDQFYPRKGYTPSARCKPCHAEAANEWANRNREKRRKIALAYYYRNKSNAN